MEWTGLNEWSGMNGVEWNEWSGLDWMNGVE
jgi:hypothetical protein